MFSRGLGDAAELIIPWPDVLGDVRVDKAIFLWQNLQKIQCISLRGG